jgi:hypothetical protein
MGKNSHQIALESFDVEKINPIIYEIITGKSPLN